MCDGPVQRRRRLLVACIWVICPASCSFACEPADFRVALDIGHTVTSPGAISARGVTEREYNAVLGANVTAALYGAGFSNLLVIAGDDTPVELAERARLANGSGAQLLISLHHDSVQPRYLRPWTVEGKDLDYTDYAEGYSIFVSYRNRQYADSLEFAVALGEELRLAALKPSHHHAEPIEGENRPYLDEELGIHRFDALAILRSATMPAVLLEAGVIKNPDEELMVGTDAFRSRIAGAIVAAVQRYCGLKATAASDGKTPCAATEPVTSGDPGAPFSRPC